MALSNGQQDVTWLHTYFCEQVPDLAVNVFALDSMVRLRRDRILYKSPPAYARRGRPAMHGHPFVFKDAATWPEPIDTVELADAHWEQVRLRRWDNLHAKQDVTLFSVRQALVLFSFL